MRYTLENKVLTIYPEGKITSDNVKGISEELITLYKENDFAKICIDCENLDYVSSAGLRMLLRVIKGRHKSEIINVNPTIHEILETTGFTELVNVESALRTVDIEGAEVIGGGFFSTVYRLDKDTIIKVYTNGTSLENIRREKNIAKKAFIYGVPCAITYDVVKAGDYYGVIFEALNAGTLLEYLIDNPDKLNEVIERYVAFLREVNSAKAPSGIFPRAKAFALEKLEIIREYVTSDEYEKIRSVFLDLEDADNIVHSDCHLGNIMLQNDDLLLIDMDTAVTGDPVFEIASLFCTYKVFEMHNPGNCKEFLGIDHDTCFALYDRTFDLYFAELTDEQKAAKKKLCEFIGWIHMLFWIKRFASDDKEFFNYCYGNLKAALERF